MSKRVIFVTGASTAQSKHFIKESGLLFLNHNAFLSTNSNTSSFHHKTCPDISSQLIIIWKTSACQIRVTWRNRPETWRNKQTVTSQRREPKIIILSKSAWLLFICQTLITILLWNLRDFCSFECLKRCHKTRQSFYMMNRFNFGFYSHSSIDHHTNRTRFWFWSEKCLQTIFSSSLLCSEGLFRSEGVKVRYTVLYVRVTADANRANFHINNNTSQPGEQLY